MSSKNRKILYDKLISEGKIKEAEKTIINHPEMAVKIETKSKFKGKK